MPSISPRFAGYVQAMLVTLMAMVPARAGDIETLLDRAVASAHRSPENRSRDIYRHPRETLLFFGLQPGMRVLEILPGAGWYTEILAPILRDHGELIVASFGDHHPVPELATLHRLYTQKLDANPAIYGKIRRILFNENGGYLAALPDGSVDMVLTFRNTHNWIRFGQAEAVYAAFFRVLKPGGILGVEQHRADPGADPRASAEQGYVPEDYLIRLAEDAGFKLVARSEINANPRDTKDHPEGVWTLPPTYRLGEKDRGKYAAIGESDRMTLKFIKPDCR